MKNCVIVKGSLLNCMPCVLKTCSRANVPCVLTCSRALPAYVPVYPVCLRAHVPTCFACLRANVLCALMRSRAIVPCVLTCQRANFDATIFNFATIFAEVVHTVGKV